jgi:hypothetical protein
MGKKKASKKASKEKLTPEQKAEKDAADAKAAEEEHTKKTELKTAFLKEKLDQEERNTRISLKKLNEQWRTILRKVKASELRKSIEILHQTFERQLDRKDATLKSLVKTLGEAERQESMALQTHIQNVDRLVEFHESLMGERHDQFNVVIQKLKDEFLTERETIISKHTVEMGNIKDMMFAMQMQFDDNEGMMAEEFSSMRDDIKTKSMEAVESLKQELEKTIGDLWELFQQALTNYKQSTKEKQDEFEALRTRDHDDQIIIKRQMKTLNRISDNITDCKLRLAGNQKEWDQRNKQLKTEKESVLRHFQKLKERMTQSRSQERVLLTNLTVESRACLDQLKSRQDTAQGLLRQAEMCRKLETEQEKVLPFYADSLSQEEIEAAGGGGPAEAVEVNVGEQAFATSLLTQQPVGKHGMLVNFWKRFNKAQLDQLAAQKERTTLETENTRLRAILKQYLDGISVSESVLQQQNTLMVVNYKTNAPLRQVPVGDGRVQQQRRQEGVELQVDGSNAARA